MGAIRRRRTGEKRRSREGQQKQARVGKVGDLVHGLL